MWSKIFLYTESAHQINQCGKRGTLDSWIRCEVAVSCTQKDVDSNFNVDVVGELLDPFANLSLSFWR